MALWYHSGNSFAKAYYARGDMGCDAYLCCPGPSLAAVNLKLLQQPGIMTFAANTAYPHIRPDWWIGLDKPACYDARLWSEPFPKVARLNAGGEKVVRCPQTYFMDLQHADPTAMLQRREHDIAFVWARSTFFAALHLMVWMGARRIRLVGCDFGGVRDYHDDRVLTDQQREYNRKLYGQQVEALRRLVPVARANGIEITSCTASSPINSFLTYTPLRKAVVESVSRVPSGGPVLHALEAETVLQ